MKQVFPRRFFAKKSSLFSLKFQLKKSPKKHVKITLQKKLIYSVPGGLLVTILEKMVFEVATLNIFSCIHALKRFTVLTFKGSRKNYQKIFFGSSIPAQHAKIDVQYNDSQPFFMGIPPLISEVLKTSEIFHLLQEILIDLVTDCFICYFLFAQKVTYNQSKWKQPWHISSKDIIIKYPATRVQASSIFP